MKLKELLVEGDFYSRDRSVEDWASDIGLTEFNITDDQLYNCKSTDTGIRIERFQFEKFPFTIKHSLDFIRLINLPNLKSLEGLFDDSYLDSSFSIWNCPKLTTLKGFEELKRVDSSLIISNCPITSLEYLPTLDGYMPGVHIEKCIKLTSLVGVENHLKFGAPDAFFSCDFDRIKEGGLGLVNVKNLSKLKTGSSMGLPKPFEIINKYLGRPDDIFECHAELIENGFDEFAKL